MSVKAVVGEWYILQNDTMLFEVVALDDVSKTIGVQFFDGSIGEYDSDAWNEMELDFCPAPEDSSGPYELEADDIDYTDESAHVDYNELALEGLYIFDDNSFEQELGVWA